MLYQDYYCYWQRYREAQRIYDEILAEKEQLFELTQPQGTDYSKDRISGGERVKVFDLYVAQKEERRLDQRLEEIKSVVTDRKELLEMKEQELRASKQWHDRIFTYYILDNLSIRQIESRIPYSRRQIYRILDEIKTKLNG